LKRGKEEARKKVQLFLEISKTFLPLQSQIGERKPDGATPEGNENKIVKQLNQTGCSNIKKPHRDGKAKKFFKRNVSSITGNEGYLLDNKLITDK